MARGICKASLILGTVLFTTACQMIVGDYGDRGTDHSTDETDSLDGGNGNDTDTDSSSETDTGPADPRSACRDEGRYWYDGNDVDARSEADFDALDPTCHDRPDENCPLTGSIFLARRLDGTTLQASVTSDAIYAYSENLVTVYSTIRCIPKLSTINFAQNLIVRLDLMNNTMLEVVGVGENSTLEWLGMPRSETIRSLFLNGNRLTELDLSQTSHLEELHAAGGNRLSALDLSNKPELRNVELGDNRIGHALDLSASDRLELLELFNNPIGEITLPNTDTLTYLDLENTGISTVDVSPYSNLSFLDVSSNDLTVLTVGGAANLQQLYAAHNMLTSLDLSENSELVTIEAWDNSFLGVLVMPEDASRVEELYLNDTALSELDLHTAAALRILYLEGNNFTTESPVLDFANKPNLQELHCTGNMMNYAVDLRDSPELRIVNFGDNRIPEIDLAPELYALEGFYIYNNELTEISFGLCPALQSLDLSDNRLTYDNSDMEHRLDLSNCHDLQTVFLVGNRNYTLSFLDGTFSDQYLSGSVSALAIETDKWETNADPRKPAWNYNDASSMYTP